MDDRIADCFAKYSGMVYRLCFVYLKSKADAEDAFQEVFIKYFTERPDFADEGHERAWLIRVSANHCKNVLKNAWNTRTVAIDETVAAVRDESDREVVRQVLALPDKYRAVILLYYYEGYSAAEIAAMLRKNGATVRTLLRRGRAMLRVKLEGEFYSGDEGVSGV